MKIFQPPRVQFAMDVVAFGGMSWSSDISPPHARTLRGSMTCPTGQRLILLSALAEAVRRMAPTTPGIFSASVVTAAGDPVVEVVSIGENPDDGRALAVARTTYIDQGTAVEMYTEDLSTGGNVIYRLSVNFLQYTI